MGEAKGQGHSAIMRCMFQISDEVGAVMVTSPASPVASGVAIMTAQNGQPRRDCCCLNLIGHYYVIYIYIYLQEIIIVYYTHTSALPMRACLVGYQAEAISIGPVQDRFWHVGARPYGHEKSNDDKTTLVAFQASLLLGGGFCDSGKLPLADISTRSTSTEGRGLLGCRLWRH